MSLPPLTDGPYRALVGDASFAFTVAEGRVLDAEGTPLDVDFAPMADGYVSLRLNGRSLPAVVEPLADGTLRVSVGGQQRVVRVQDAKALLLEKYGLDKGAGTAEREVRAPMPGLVLQVMIEPGQEVAAGDGIVVLEAMKMENELRAAAGGVVESVHVEAGTAVGKNDLLVTFAA